MNFYTLREAAQAIAAQLHPHDDDARGAETERYRYIIYDALCAGDLTGRNPSGRDPIDRALPRAIIAFHGCVINDRDLDDWLDRLGNGVRVTDIPRHSTSAKPGPTSREFAEMAEPYLCAGFGREDLVKLLGDAKDDKGLKALRTLDDEGRRAHWNQPGKLVLELVARGKIMEQSAWQFVEQHYPDHVVEMGKKPEQKRSATWISGL